MLLAALFLASLPSDVPARSVVAGPEDIASGLVRLPAPEELGSSSRAAWLALRPTEGADGVRRAEGVVPVPGGPLALGLLGGDLDGWHAELELPGALAGSLEELARTPGARLAEARLDGALDGALLRRLDLPATGAGLARVRVRLDAGAFGGPAALVLRDGSDVELVAHPTSVVWRSDAPPAVRALFRGEAPLERAHLRVSVDGAEWTLPMHDDGGHEDHAAGDGVFGAFVPAGLDARARVRVEGYGREPGGAPVLRTAELVLPLSAAVRDLTGDARLSVAEGVLRVAVGTAGTLGRAHLSAELWGAGPEGAPVPVAWLSRIAAPDAGGDLELRLDPAWVAAADAGAPFELRAVRVQHPDSHAVLDLRAALALDVSGDAVADAVRRAAGTPPPAPLGAFAPALQAQHYRRGLVLVHGYCSTGAWPVAQFSEPKLEFQDFDANRSHDEFAQLLAQQAAGFDSFGVVGHSQGGAAALHLLTYYESGLDEAVGGRRIQSVGTPYQGTPLAPLGGIIPGVGCGANDDMSPSGALLWLAGIPGWARDEVHFWTTSEAGSSPCNLLSSFILSGEEDGTTERARGQLPLANGEGHDYGWCHTTGMSETAQYLDAARNAEMDAAAAR